MKGTILSVAALAFLLVLTSWGFKGHRAVATIAQKHLISNTAYIVSAYLKGQSMAEVSTGPTKTGIKPPLPGISSACARRPEP
jgi:hypothetical protein